MSPQGELLRRYATKGVLLDTNLLLLLVVGRWKRARVRTFKRTMMYTEEDFDLIDRLARSVVRCVATPGIWAEVNSLSSQLPSPELREARDQLRREITIFSEEYLPASQAAEDACFAKLGLTDASTFLVAAKKYLVITDDWPLFGALVQRKIDAININHIRGRAWLEG